MEDTGHLKAGTHVDTSPSPAAPRVILLPLEGRDGYAFALTVAEVKRASPDAGLACRLVEEHVGRIPSTLGEDDHPQHRFETFLADINAAISQVVRTTEWTLPIKAFRSVVGIVCDGEMYLSGTGDLTALFLHQAPDRRYQVFNLARSIQTEQALPTWEKPFAVVLDGRMDPGDVFCLCNRDLAPAIGNEDLCGILSTLPPTGAAAKIRQYFPFNDVLALLVLRAEVDMPTLEAATPRAELSLGRLVEAREQTDRLIEDQAPRPATLIAGLLRRLRRGEEDDAVRRPRRGLAATLAGRALRAARGVMWRVGGAFRRPVQEQRARIVRATPVPFLETLSGALKRAASGARSRTLVAASLLVLLVLVGSVMGLSRAREAQRLSAAIGEEVARAEELREQAAAAAIYRDDGRAIALYEQARASVDALAPDTPERQEAVARLRQEIASGLDRLYRVVHLADVPLVVPLAGGRALAADGTGLYAFLADASVRRIDPGLKQETALPLPASEAGIAAEAAAEDGRVLFLDDRPGVSLLALETPALQVTSLAPAAGEAWKDLASYGGRLYVLAALADDAQVLRIGATTSGFGAPTGWIRSKTTSLAAARSLAVDGSVFVLTADRLVRFMNGGETGFDARAAVPPMRDATDVWTAFESERAYVLEPAQRRVLAFDKDDGSLIAQYQADAFATATDLHVDEGSGTVYVLAAEGLYGFKATQ